MKYTLTNNYKGRNKITFESPLNLSTYEVAVAFKQIYMRFTTKNIYRNQRYMNRSIKQ